MHSFNKSDFDSNYAIVCFYHVCFYHLIINEANVNICSYSLATFNKKNAYLKIKALSIEICNRNFKIRKIKMSSYYDKMKIV